jgi:hypothetical protein
MSLLSNLRFYKQSQDPVAPPKPMNTTFPEGTTDFRTSLQKEQDYKEKMRLLTNIGKFGLGGLGAGAVLGGLNSLRRFAMQPTLSDSPVTVSEDDEELPYPVLARRRIKRAMEKSGDGWEDVQKYPLYAPGMTLAGIGGVLGGMSGVNYLASQRMKSLQDEEVEEEKKKYEKALLGQYPRGRLRPHPYAKIASESPVDELYDEWEKKGIFGPAKWLYDTVSTMSIPSMYAAYAIPAAALAGGYSYSKYMNQNERIMNAALKRRQAMRSLEQPTPLYLQPRPVEVEPEEDEDDNMTPRKKRKRIDENARR